MARKSKKQPYAYAKRGADGKWHHWRHLASAVAKGAALGGGIMLGKLLFGDVISLFGLQGLTKDLFDGVGDLFRWE